MSVVIIACFVALLYSMWLIGRSRTGTEAYLAAIGTLGWLVALVFLATVCAPASTPPRSTTTTTAWERICGPTTDAGWECR